MPQPSVCMGQAFLPLFGNTDPFILVESPRGALKTCSILNVLMSRAARWPGKRWYIWRSTRALLSTTVLPTFEEYVIPAWDAVKGMRLLNPNARPTQRSEYIFENGSVFLPVGMDDILRGTSAEGAGGYLAEAIELESKDRATALVGMMRQPGVPFHQIMVDVNPGHPNHWANTSCEPIEPSLRHVSTRDDYDRLQEYNRRPTVNPLALWKRLVARVQDNPFYFDVEAWEFTQDGKDYMRALGTLSGHLEARWVRGEWVAAEGSVFGADFSESRNVVDDFEPPAHWPVWISIDPGYDHPCSVGFYTVAPNGCRYRFDEIYVRRESIAAVARMIQERGRIVLSTYLDPRHGFMRTQQSPRTIAEQFGDAGIVCEPYPRVSGSEFDASVNAHRIALARDEFKICRRCKSGIMEHQSWSYKRNAQGEQLTGDDAYADRDNHSIDESLGWERTNPTFTPSRIRFADMPPREPYRPRAEGDVSPPDELGLIRFG